tara:strand:+ start:327 stop:446 length:120 start_codon:yes stop_codon:yes gene_type:complete
MGVQDGPEYAFGDKWLLAAVVLVGPFQRKCLLVPVSMVN